MSKAPPLAASQRPLRVVLYVLLVATAAAAMFLQPALSGAVQRGAVAPFWLFLPIALFGAVFVLAAVDRWLLVRQRRYPAGRAFFQLAVCVIFASVLLPTTLREFKAQRGTGQDRLLRHSDPEIRRAAVLAAGFERPTPEAEARIRACLDDADARVRSAATQVLQRWASRTGPKVQPARSSPANTSSAAEK